MERVNPSVLETSMSPASLIMYDRKKLEKYKSIVPKTYPGLILGLGPANERRRYDVTSFLIGWTHT